MSLWKLKGYVENDGQSVVRQWCNSVDDIVWLAFETDLDYLCGQLPDKWKRPWVGTLSGGKRQRKAGCAGLYELRFEVGNVQHRPLFYYSDEMEITILFFAEERGGDFVPRNACEIAKTRRRLIESDKERAREFAIKKESNT